MRESRQCCAVLLSIRKHVYMFTFTCLRAMYAALLPPPFLDSTSLLVHKPLSHPFSNQSHYVKLSTVYLQFIYSLSTVYLHVIYTLSTLCQQLCAVSFGRARPATKARRVRSKSMSKRRRCGLSEAVQRAQGRARVQRREPTECHQQAPHGDLELQRSAKTTSCGHKGSDPVLVNKAGSRACAAVKGMGREARTKQGSALSQSPADVDERYPMPFMEVRACSCSLAFL